MTKKWSAIDILWLVLAVTIVFVAIVYKFLNISESIDFFSIVSGLSAIFGVFYVICIAKQERIAYLFGIANVILYALVVYNKGLYISAAYNLLYSFPVLIYGYIYWGKLEALEDNDVRVLSIKKKIIGVLFMGLAVICLALISERFLGGTNVWLDSIVSVLVCVATFLLAKKYIEQWYLFIISNFMGIVLFFPKNLSDTVNIDLFAMWSVYFINSIYGYILWKKSLIRKKD